MDKRKIVFVIVEFYEPGYKSGGPVRTIRNMVDWLNGYVEFYIYTRDRDSGDSNAYPDILVNHWQTVGGAKVFYASPENFRRGLIKEIEKTAPDVVYLNSFFRETTFWFLLARRYRSKGRLKQTRVVLAPRGEFSPGAFEEKKWKKVLFVFIGVRVLGLFRNVHWHASTHLEAQEIFSRIQAESIESVINFSPRIKEGKFRLKELKKVPGVCRFIFCSRISRIKNIRFLIDILRDLRGNVEVDVVGENFDPYEWGACEDMILNLPKNIRVQYHGAVPNSEVMVRLAGSHFFVLPTLGENFGHAIVEAFRAGCPPIISDRTPWRELNREMVGWDLPLDRSKWLNVMGDCIEMGNEEYQRYSSNSIAKGLALSARPPVAAMVRLLTGDTEAHKDFNIEFRE